MMIDFESGALKKSEVDAYKQSIIEEISFYEAYFEGNDTSPQIEIEGANATSLAMIMDDPDAPVSTFTNWVIWNMPPTDKIPANFPKNASVEEPFWALQGNNSAGKIGYLGPCPSPGKPHRYCFHVYGLDMMLDLQPGSSRKDLEEAMQGHMLQKGETIAPYGR